MPADRPPIRLELPPIRLEFVEDLSPADSGFLRLVRRRYRAHYPDGSTSKPFTYDAVDRAALDAVVIVAHQRGHGGRPEVWLRSAVRPPLALRTDLGGDAATRTGLWELPAGLVEPDEGPDDRERRAARRELAEELGFEVPLESLSPLGPPAYPSPGITAERHYYFQVAVDGRERGEPALDGSDLERFGVVVAVGLEDALGHCASGEIEDAKTELALRRLKDRLR